MSMQKMFSGFTSTLEAFFTAIAKISDWQCEKTTHMSESEMIDTVKDSEKAIDAAERALLIADKYQHLMRLKDRLNYVRWSGVFRKYN